MAAVVPVYRCGAVPDSHRVPSYDALYTIGRGTPTTKTIYTDHALRVNEKAPMTNNFLS
jgi:hypothetical protein